MSGGSLGDSHTPRDAKAAVAVMPPEAMFWTLIFVNDASYLLKCYESYKLTPLFRDEIFKHRNVGRGGDILVLIFTADVQGKKTICL